MARRRSRRRSTAAPHRHPPLELTFDHRSTIAPRRRFAISLSGLARYAEWMTVGELLVRMQRLPRDAELLAMEPGCEEYCEREVDEVEWQVFSA